MVFINEFLEKLKGSKKQTRRHAIIIYRKSKTPRRAFL